jgi:hypothetical protein
MDVRKMLLKLALAHEVVKGVAEVFAPGTVEGAPDDWAFSGAVESLAEVIRELEASLPIYPPSNGEEFAHGHQVGCDQITVTCHECGCHLPFRFSPRPGRLSIFAPPHDCECGVAQVAWQ